MWALLVGIQEATGFDARECDAFVGTSAGSIVAAVLAAGIEPGSRLGELPEQPAVEDAQAQPNGRAAAGVVARLALTTGRSLVAPFAAAGLRSTATGGALFRRAALALAPTGQRSLGGFGVRLDSAGATWDGRLLVSAVDVGSGRRVMFGSAGAPEASVGDAVEASCAIPGVFHPIRIGDRDYVDGGAWSPTNMDVAPAKRGSTVLCLNPTGSLRSSFPGPLGALGLVSRSVAAVEALALERRGAQVITVAPDAATVAAIGGNLMNPRPRAQVVAAGLAQGRALGLSA